MYKMGDEHRQASRTYHIGKTLYNTAKHAFKAYAGATGTAKTVENLTGLPVSNVASAAGTYINHAISTISGEEGERHAKLVNKEGHLVSANYMGPGTNLIGRLRAKDEPVSLADKVAMLHDIRYTEAQNDPRAAWRNIKIRQADVNMLKELGNIEELELDTPFNVNQGKWLMYAKIQGENRLPTWLGGKMGWFGGEYKENRFSETDETLMQEARAKLEREFAEMHERATQRRNKRQKTEP
jgi:hypothetical protein